MARCLIPSIARRSTVVVLGVLGGLGLVPTASMAQPADRSHAPGGRAWVANEATRLQARQALANLPRLPAGRADAIAQATKLKKEAAELAAKGATGESLARAAQATQMLEKAFGNREVGLAAEYVELAQRLFAAGKSNEALRDIATAESIINNAEPDCDRSWRPEDWLSGIQLQRAVWLFDLRRYDEAKTASNTGHLSDENPADRSYERFRATGSFQNQTVALCQARGRQSSASRPSGGSLKRAQELAHSGNFDEARAALQQAATEANAEVERASPLAADNSSFLPTLDRLAQVEAVALSWLSARPTDGALAAIGLELVASRQNRLFDASAGLAPAADALQLDLFRRQRAEMARAYLRSYSPNGKPVASSVRANRLLAEKETVLGNEARLNQAVATVRLAEATHRNGQAAAGTHTLLAERLKEALPANEALVNYVVFKPGTGEARYGAFVMKGREAQVVFIDLATKSDVDTKLVELTGLCSNPNSSLATLESASERLYDLLWQPLTQALGSPSHIYVVGDAALDSFPLEVLHHGGAWLLSQQALSYAGSARELLRPSAAPAGERVSSPRIYAHPRPPADQSLYPALKNLHFSDLPGTDAEAKVIHQYFPQAELVAGARADEPSLLNVASPRFLHIATHGVFLVPPPGRSAENDDDWIRSALVLSPPSRERDGPWDSFTTAFEIARMQLRATSLVVLSGCDTNLGAISAQHGARSLKSAFMIAGARTVIASSWPVDDPTTATLMNEFYSALSKGQPIDSALREAKNHSHDEHFHPYYWGAWTLTGNAGAL